MNLMLKGSGGTPEMQIYIYIHTEAMKKWALHNMSPLRTGVWVSVNVIPPLVARWALRGCSPRQTFSLGSDAHSTRGSFAEHLQAACGMTCTAPPACTAVAQTHTHTLTQVRDLQAYYTILGNLERTDITSTPTLGNLNKIAAHKWSISSGKQVECCKHFD